MQLSIRRDSFSVSMPMLSLTFAISYPTFLSYLRFYYVYAFTKHAAQQSINNCRLDAADVPDAMLIDSLMPPYVTLMNVTI
jgi:hypothetical protein